MPELLRRKQMSWMLYANVYQDAKRQSKCERLTYEFSMAANADILISEW